MSISKKKQEELKEEKDWERLDEAVMESGRFLGTYQKQILIGIGAVILIVCGYLAYDAFYKKPKAEEAQTAIFKGETYFREGKDSLALFGNGNDYLGLESVINEYGSTKTGDLAKGYAGVIYTRMGEYEKALPYLKDYSGSDALFTYLVKGSIGDCLVNTGKIEESISYFESAAKGMDNELYSPIYYKKAALAYKEMKNYKKVAEIYEYIKNNYGSSMEASEADKYILEANMLQGK